MSTFAFGLGQQLAKQAMADPSLAGDLAQTRTELGTALHGAGGPPQAPAERMLNSLLSIPGAFSSASARLQAELDAGKGTRPTQLLPALEQEHGPLTTQQRMSLGREYQPGGEVIKGVTPMLGDMPAAFGISPYQGQPNLWQRMMGYRR